jgi:transposase
MENATTILFGLPGVAVDRVECAADGRGGWARLVHVVASASSAAGCPECGVVSASVKQYRTTRPRDLPYGEEPLAVRWRKRQFRWSRPARVGRSRRASPRCRRGRG